MRTHLAHGQHHKPTVITRCASRQTAALDLSLQQGPQRGLNRVIGENGQRMGDALQLPHAAAIGQRHIQRQPALGAAQGNTDLIRRQAVMAPHQPGQHHVGIGVPLAGQPVALAHKQAAQIGAAAGNTPDQRSQIVGQVTIGGKNLVTLFRLMRNRGATGFLGKRHGRRMMPAEGAVNRACACAPPRS